MAKKSKDVKFTKKELNKKIEHIEKNCDCLNK